MRRTVTSAGSRRTWPASSSSPINAAKESCRLLDAFEAAAREAGAREVILRTIAGGPADVFYRRRGWAEYGRLPAWRNGRDFVQLRHRLT